MKVKIKTKNAPPMKITSNWGLVLNSFFADYPMRSIGEKMLCNSFVYLAVKKGICLYVKTLQIYLLPDTFVV